MKVIAFLLLSCFAVAEDASLAVVVDGAKALHQTVRDPDSLKISKASIVRNKFGEAFCYDYSARNGFGGMDSSHAVYAVGKHGKYSLSMDDDKSFTSEFFFRCGSKALKNASITDVTKEAREGLATASNP